MIHHDSKLDVNQLLETAEEFVRAGDYLEAHARARQVQDELGDGTEESQRVARTLRRYGVLVEAWHAQNAARSAVYVARERRAIGADEHEPTERVTAWSQAAAWLRRRTGPAHRATPPRPAVPG
ncbi:uncharacterized protein SOCE26_019340 [Sorangium cellulosum]|uniref:Uncharacterized protein n=1 Tax=Sorangium cellulosum TaxID=56 RepID=A0A2L0EMK5_SORCE|nr:hypothetical protein [Sorangium cellulosum]AUX40533.1 uncharacterized protein SOCE26_019340 [Sorangium cellulosum]